MQMKLEGGLFLGRWCTHVLSAQKTRNQRSRPGRIPLLLSPPVAWLSCTMDSKAIKKGKVLVRVLTERALSQSADVWFLVRTVN